MTHDALQKANDNFLRTDIWFEDQLCPAQNAKAENHVTNDGDGDDDNCEDDDEKKGDNEKF